MPGPKGIGSVDDTMGPRGAIPSWLQAALTSRRIAWLLAAAYVAWGLGFVATDHVLNDEGLFTHTWASALRAAPLDVFFFQKAKPAVSVLYAPFAALGVRATMTAHVLVAAAALPLAAAVARALGARAPNLAALAVGASPLHFVCGASGVSNTDGVTGALVVLWLLTVRRADVLAGLTLAALPWVRSELGLFCVFVAAWGIAARRPRFVGAAAAAVSAYALAGAAWHHDAAWLAHFPGATAKPMPGNPVWIAVTLGVFPATLVATTPFVFVAAASPWRALSTLERVLAAHAVTWLVAMALLVEFKLANFGFVPRYALPALPALALLAARAPDVLGANPRPRRVVAATVATVAAAWGAGSFAWSGAVGVALAAWCVALALAARGRVAAALSTVLGLALVAPALPNRLDMTRHDLAPYLPAMTEWLTKHRAEIAGPVYTNSPLLAVYLRHRGGADAPNVTFLVGRDQLFEVTALTDERNGQREAIRGVLVDDLNGGRAMLPDDVKLDAFAEGAIFALRNDKRIDLLLPPGEWGPHFEPLVDAEFRILRFHRDAGR